MSLYADYVKERLGWETIEVEGGFISFALRPPECSIEEFYLAPGQRGTGLAQRLGDAVFSRAKESGAERVWATVVPGAGGAERAMKTIINYGFKLAGYREGKVVLMKEVK